MFALSALAVLMSTQLPSGPVPLRDFGWVSQPWTADGSAYYKVSLDNRAKSKLEIGEYTAHMEVVKKQYIGAPDDPAAIYSYLEVACLNRWGNINNSPVINETPEAIEGIFAKSNSPHVAEWDYLRYLNFFDIPCGPKGHKFLADMGDRLLQYYKGPDAIRHWVVLKNQIFHLGFSASRDAQDQAVEYGRLMAKQKASYKPNLALALENRFIKFKDAVDGHEAISLLESLSTETTNPDVREKYVQRIAHLNDLLRGAG